MLSSTSSVHSPQDSTSRASHHGSPSSSQAITTSSKRSPSSEPHDVSGPESSARGTRDPMLPHDSAAIPRPVAAPPPHNSPSTMWPEAPSTASPLSSGLPIPCTPPLPIRRQPPRPR